MLYKITVELTINNYDLEDIKDNLVSELNKISDETRIISEDRIKCFMCKKRTAINTAETCQICLDELMESK